MLLRDRFDPRYFDADVLFRYHAGWAGLSHTRASTATLTDRTGTLREAGPAVPRIDWSHGRPALRLEPARTNQIRNPRGEGAVLGTLGSGGALPTFWARHTTGGLTWEVVGTGVEDGISYVDVRLHGTPTQTFAQMRFEDTTAVAAGPGQTWTGTFYSRLVAGSMSGIGEAGVLIQERSAGGTILNQDRTTFDPTDAPRLGLARRAHTRILSSPDTAAVVLLLDVAGMTVGNAVDVTFRVGAPQLEQAPIPSSLILPPPGAPAAATRATETVTAPWPHAPQAMTVYARFVEAGTIAITSGWPRIVQIGGGTGARLVMYCNNAGRYGFDYFTAAGVSRSVVLATGPSIGQTVELLGTLYPDGSVQLTQSIDGGSVTATTRSAASALSSAWSAAMLRIGSAPGGGSAGQTDLLDLLILRGAGWTMDHVRSYLPGW